MTTGADPWRLGQTFTCEFEMSCCVAGQQGVIVGYDGALRRWHITGECPKHGQTFSAWIGGPDDPTLYELSVSIGLLENGVYYPGLREPRSTG